MVFLFRDRSVVNILLVLLLSVGVHIHQSGQVQAITAIADHHNGLFSYVLANYIYSLPAPVQVILFHALIVTQALRLNMVMQDLRMFASVNYVPAMTYVLLTGLLMQSDVITETLVSNSLTLWMFIKLRVDGIIYMDLHTGRRWIIIHGIVQCRWVAWVIILGAGIMPFLMPIIKRGTTPKTLL